MHLSLPLSLQVFFRETWCLRNGHMKPCRESSCQSKVTVDGCPVCKWCIVSYEEILLPYLLPWYMLPNDFGRGQPEKRKSID